MKTDIICLMRLLAAMMLVPVVALGVTVESLPPSAYADTEMSTEIGEIVLVEGRKPSAALIVR